MCSQLQKKGWKSQGWKPCSQSSTYGKQLLAKNEEWTLKMRNNHKSQANINALISVKYRVPYLLTCFFPSKLNRSVRISMGKSIAHYILTYTLCGLQMGKNRKPTLYPLFAHVGPTQCPCGTLLGLPSWAPGGARGQNQQGPSGTAQLGPSWQPTWVPAGAQLGMLSGLLH